MSCTHCTKILEHPTGVEPATCGGQMLRYIRRPQDRLGRPVRCLYATDAYKKQPGAFLPGCLFFEAVSGPLWLSPIVIITQFFRVWGVNILS